MIYLDNAATTKTAPEAVKAMLPYFTELYGNPSGLYGAAQKSKKAVTAARAQIAALLGADPSEIYFTAGGTESDNWALKAAFEAHKEKGNHIITTKIEHHAILHTCAYLERERGAKVTYLDVDKNGLVNPADVEAAITPETILISVMYANNEIGTLQPVQEIGAIAREHGIWFHTDAVQAVGQVPIDLKTLPADMLSASAHKLGGPKGIGFLYIRKGLKIRSFLHGGQQERKRRAGTENVPGIVGFGAAAQLAQESMDARIETEIALRDHLIKRMTEEVPLCRLNGDPLQRLPGNTNFSFEFVDGESLLILLDMQEICASAGSACASGSLDPSHVLTAIGLPNALAQGSLRLTLNAENTMEEIDKTVDAVKKIVQSLRERSPRWADYKAGTLASELETADER